MSQSLSHQTYMAQDMSQTPLDWKWMHKHSGIPLRKDTTRSTANYRKLQVDCAMQASILQPFLYKAQR